MKSNEFILKDEVINERSYTHSGIEKELIYKGYKFLGAGVDQSAYLEPDGQTVLKVFGAQGEIGVDAVPFTRSHQMFFTWAKFCMKNEDNPFLPRFGGYESFVFQGKTYLQIRQELLHKAGKLGEKVANLSVMIKSYGLSDVNLGIRLRELSPIMGEENARLLARTISALQNIGVTHSYSWDLHKDNVMKRNNKTPVIVDPWVVF